MPAKLQSLLQSRSFSWSWSGRGGSSKMPKYAKTTTNVEKDFWTYLVAKLEWGEQKLRKTWLDSLRNSEISQLNFSWLCDTIPNSARFISDWEKGRRFKPLPNPPWPTPPPLSHWSIFNWQIREFDKPQPVILLINDNFSWSPFRSQTHENERLQSSSL